jgi:hypothetical protein
MSTTARPSVAMPIVAMFRPTHYEVVPQHKLAEWETALANHVGLDAVTFARKRTATQCACAGPPPEGEELSEAREWQWDDCDIE